MSKSIVYTQLKKMLQQRTYAALFIISASFMAVVLSILSNIPYVRGNFGDTYTTILIITIVCIALLFGITISALVLHIVQTTKIPTSQTTMSTVASFLAILVAGCSVCGVSIASLLGLATILSTFPFYGLELKIISVFLLLYSSYSLLSKTSCPLKKQTLKKDKKHQ